MCETKLYTHNRQPHCTRRKKARLQEKSHNSLVKTWSPSSRSSHQTTRIRTRPSNNKHPHMRTKGGALWVLPSLLPSNWKARKIRETCRFQRREVEASCSRENSVHKTAIP